jgi:hypothetical protein
MKKLRWDYAKQSFISRSVLQYATNIHRDGVPNDPIFRMLVSTAEKRKDNPSWSERLAAEMENAHTGERHEPIHPLKWRERLTGGNVGQ